MLIFNNNWLDFFDKLSNSVLMPVCALGSCIALGWFLDKKITLNPIKTLKTLNNDGLSVGKLDKIFVVMLKYVSPILILVIEIFGVKDLIFPNNVFDINGLGIVITAYSILILTIIFYFIFLHNKETGKNEDELYLE